MPDWNFQGSVAGGVAGSAGVSSQGQAALSCLRRRWPKEGGPKMMLSPHTHTSGGMGSPEDHRTSCLFHKIKSLGKSSTGTQPLPSRKREEAGSLTGGVAQPLVSPAQDSVGCGLSCRDKPPVTPPGRQPAGTSWGCQSLLWGAGPHPTGTQSGTHWGSQWSMSFLAERRTQNLALGCNGQQFPKQRM